MRPIDRKLVRSAREDEKEEGGGGGKKEEEEKVHKNGDGALSLLFTSERKPVHKRG